MPRLMGQHHTTITARTKEALDLAIERWRARLESELDRFRAEPDGITTTLHECEGPRVLKLTPQWARTCELSHPSDLELRFETNESEWNGLLRADLCAELVDTRRQEPAAPTDPIHP